METFVVPDAIDFEGPSLRLNKMDEKMFPMNFRIHFIYPEANVANVEDRLRSSLKTALGLFPPFAATLEYEADGHPVINCKKIMGASLAVEHRSTLFAEIEGGDDDSLASRGTDLRDGAPVLAFKLTTFACGTIVIGTSFNHKVADLDSFSDFLHTWASVSREGQPHASKAVRKWDRNPLRFFSDIVPDTVSEIAGFRLLPSPPTGPPIFPPSLNARFQISQFTLDRLKASPLLPVGTFVSTADIMSSLLWGAVTRAHFLAGHAPMAGSQARAGIAMNGRKRIPTLRNHKDYFFGNYVTPFDVAVSTEQLTTRDEENLILTAVEVRRELLRQSTPAHLCGTLELLETLSVPQLGLICDVIITSWSSFNLTGPEFDFGWGSPAAATPGCAEWFPGFIHVNKTAEGDQVCQISVCADSIEHLMSDPLLQNLGTLVKI